MTQVVNSRDRDRRRTFDRSTMAIYYFNVRCDDFETTDLVGEECSSPEVVRREALSTARELVVNDLLAGRAPRRDWVEVEDKEHRTVMLLPLSAAAS